LKYKTIMAFSIGPVGAAILGLITLPIITWLFSIEDVGRLAMFQLAISFSWLIFSFGLDQAYVREFHEVEDKQSLLKATILPGQLALACILILFISLPWSITQFLFGIDSTYLMILLFVGLLSSFYARFFGLILRMQERGIAFSMSQLLPKILFLIILLVYIVFSIDAKFENLLLAFVISLVAVFIIFAWNTRFQWVPALTATIDRVKFKEMVRYGVPLIGGGLAFWGLTAMDKIFLRALSSFEELGIYAVAINFAGAALVFKTVFSTVWLPTIYKWAAEGVEPERVKRTIDNVTFAVIVIWSVAGILSWVVTLILPTEYAQVQFILLAAMAYPLLYTLSEATGVGIGIERKTTYLMVAAIIALIINGIGNYYLIPILGASGAATASAISFFIFFILRTEISSILWMGFERRRMYIISSIALTMSILVNIMEIPVQFSVIIWLSILLVSLFMFKQQAKDLLSGIKNKVKGGV